MSERDIVEWLRGRAAENQDVTAGITDQAITESERRWGTSPTFTAVRLAFIAGAEWATSTTTGLTDPDTRPL